MDFWSALAGAFGGTTFVGSITAVTLYLLRRRKQQAKEHADEPDIEAKRRIVEHDDQNFIVKTYKEAMRVAREAAREAVNDQKEKVAALESKLDGMDRSLKTIQADHIACLLLNKDLTARQSKIDDEIGLFKTAYEECQTMNKHLTTRVVELERRYGNVT